VKRTILVTGGKRRIGRAISERLVSHGWDVVAVGREDFDLADPLGAARMFESVCASHPQLSYIVNNAAVFDPSLDDGTAMRVNFESPEKLTTLLGLRLMEHAPFRGAVVNLLDVRILASAHEGESAYERSKRALLEATRRQAGLFADSIRVNAVAPGPVLAPEHVREKGGETLLPRRPSPEDVAQAVEFLLSAEAVTGCVIPVDSGQHLL